MSDRLRIAPRSTTEVLDDLEAKGLVERRPDPQDRRATLVVPTERGTELATEISAGQGSEAERVFDAGAEAELARSSEHLDRAVSLSLAAAAAKSAVARNLPTAAERRRRAHLLGFANRISERPPERTLWKQ